MQDGVLTGRMVDQPWGDICDGEEKRRMLLETCTALGIAPHQAIAMGDGANDLPMMGAAGLSVAYHAKPAVRAQAHGGHQQRRAGPPAGRSGLRTVLASSPHADCVRCYKFHSITTRPGWAVVP
jgi:3-deoxy-D-manno-octulosonate 8-phosphate phosphatase KdsC-like HAD superfamily phosphatase